MIASETLLCQLKSAGCPQFLSAVKLSSKGPVSCEEFHTCRETTWKGLAFLVFQQDARQLDTVQTGQSNALKFVESVQIWSPSQLILWNVGWIFGTTGLHIRFPSLCPSVWLSATWVRRGTGQQVASEGDNYRSQLLPLLLNWLASSRGLYLERHFCIPHAHD